MEAVQGRTYTMKAQRKSQPLFGISQRIGHSIGCALLIVGFPLLRANAATGIAVVWGNNSSDQANVPANVQGGIKSIAVGSGFTLPPLDYPTFPPLRSDLSPSIPEARLLSVARTILSERGAADLPETLPEVFRTEARLPVGE